MHQKILLTGSNGLLGQKIVALLAGRLNVDLKATGRGVNRNSIREGYTYEALDLTDKLGLADLFEQFQPDAVIHTAAMTQVDGCEDDKEACDLINIDVVKSLAELCKAFDAHLVHISTDFIFDGQDGPYQETDNPGPVNYYGLSKLKAEQVVESSGCSYAILRTILLYGVTPAMSRSNIVLWAKSSLESGKAIRVVNDQQRCPTLAEDLAAASISAVMKKAKGVFHISGPEMMRIVDIVYHVADFWKLDKSLISEIDSESLGQRAKRPPVTGFIILKAQTELDYKPHTLKQGLALLDRQLREFAT